MFEKYICVYYDGKNYLDFSKKYLDHINSLAYLNSTVDESDNLVENTEIKVLKSNYSRTDKKIYLYHILINMS